ncbi:MAG: hypothetical protein ACAI44_19390, partial [Candidatus Sericytochromatia bacterium]
LFENTKNGWKRVSDPMKKVRTDALTEGLSWLGFSADVFMGRFDDAKYVQKLQQELAEAEKQGQPGKPPEKPKPDLGHLIKPLPAAQNQRDDIDALRKKLRIPGTQFTEWLAGYGYVWQTLSDSQAADVLIMLREQLAEQEAQKALKLSAEYSQTGGAA